MKITTAAGKLMLAYSDPAYVPTILGIEREARAEGAAAERERLRGLVGETARAIFRAVNEQGDANLYTYSTEPVVVIGKPVYLAGVAALEQHLQSALLSPEETK